MNDTLTETTRGYDIPASLATDALAKVEKVNRRLTRLGLSLYRVAITPNPDRVVYDVVDGRELYREARVLVTITGDVPRLADWQPVATLTRDPDAGVITRVWPGLVDEPDLSAYRGTEPSCDHCHLTRTRVDTFVVRHTVTGEMSQVGRTCLAAFTGVEVGIPMWVATGDDDLDEMGTWTGGAGDLRWPVQHVLQTALAIAGRWGYVSKTQATESYGQRTATAEIVMDALSGTSLSCQELRALIAADVDAAATRAAEVRDYAAHLVDTETGEYVTNLAAVAAADMVGYRNVPLLVSAVSSFARNAERLVRDANKTESTWQGDVDDKLVLDLTVTRTTVLDGQWGSTTLVLFLDAAGNEFKWFASRALRWEAGDTVQLKGTVKAHDEYNGVKQTQLTRCKVIAFAEHA